MRDRLPETPVLGEPSIFVGLSSQVWKIERSKEMVVCRTDVILVACLVVFWKEEEKEWVG